MFDFDDVSSKILTETEARRKVTFEMWFPANVRRVSFVFLVVAVVEPSVVFRVDIEDFSAALRVIGLVIKNPIISVVTNCLSQLLAVGKRAQSAER